MSRAVGKHLQRTFKYHIHGQLMAACAHAHWLIKHITELLFRCIDHGSRGIIYRTGHHPDKRQEQIVIGSNNIRPFVPFQSPHTFPGEYIRICPVETSRLISSMKIDKQMMFCSCTGDLPIIIYHPRIVTLHKINFYTFNSPLLKLIKSFFQLIIKSFPYYPQNNTYIFRFGIGK